MDIRFVHIGKGNVLNALEVLYILPPGRTDGHRLVEESKKAKRLIDATAGRKTRSLIVLKNGTVVKCLLSYEALMNRLNGKTAQVTKEDKIELEDEEKDEAVLDTDVSDVPDAGAEDE